jgi:hypothetical protein
MKTKPASEILYSLLFRKNANRDVNGEKASHVLFYGLAVFVRKL